MASEKAASWEFEEGHEIAPGRTVLKPIGGGSAYEVVLVFDDRLFSIMVAKVVRPDQLEDESTMRGLRREAEALHRLAHPCLIRGFDAVLEPPYPHVLIEHLEGPTLRRLIKRHGPLPQEQLLPLALHVASVLHYMAEEEVVHLDVKPDNIVMGVPPRLIDLSVARPFGRAREIQGAIGTDPYMAPEQCGGFELRGGVGGETDVWGLGATLYHALAGRVPFPRERGAGDSGERDKRFPQLVADPEPLPRDVPEPLVELILATLRKDPAERPTAKELALGLEPLVASMPQLVRLGRGGAARRRPDAPIPPGA
jgi:eukaryotic-like serine/threonine-protein kinase